MTIPRNDVDLIRDLRNLITFFSRDRVAAAIGVTDKTLRCWLCDNPLDMPGRYPTQTIRLMVSLMESQVSHRVACAIIDGAIERKSGSNPTD